MSKKLHVNAYVVPAEYVEGFLIFVNQYNSPTEAQEEEDAPSSPRVEILYQEEGKATVPNTSFDLWFATPATGFYFGLAWAERRDQLAKFQAELHEHAAQQPPYPQFLYHPKLRTWLRYNSAEYFCIVSEDNLQVRRERPQVLFKPDEVEVVSEAVFLENYQRVARLLRERAEQHLATYQRRGSQGNEWFYCHLFYAGGAKDLQKHLRLNVSASAHGRSWQLLYDYDRHWNDARRVASTEPEFAQQLHALLQEAEAAATGQEGGPSNG